MEPALRRSFLLPVVACLAGGPVAAQAPFAPHTDQPDYVVTMVWKFQGETRNRTVTHHGEWTYVSGVGHFSADGDGSISVFGGVSSASFERGRTMPDSYDTEPRNTGERQMHLGESCTVWDVWRTKREPAGFGRTHLSCVTDDGIEL